MDAACAGDAAAVISAAAADLSILSILFLGSALPFLSFYAIMFPLTHCMRNDYLLEGSDGVLN
jgi:hypothetical protein